MPKLEISVPLTAAQSEILSKEAQDFLVHLSTQFEPRRRELLARRVTRQAEIDAGKFPDFLPETKSIREADWTVASIPADLQDRRVEITGPVDRKMVINALNSGANVFMADFEDANSPSWSNNIDGQINVRDAVHRAIEYKSPEGKPYKLNPQIATLLVRPRGWHLHRKARNHRWPSHLRLALRFRLVLLPQCEGTDPQRLGSVLLSALQMESPFEARLAERRIHV